jgi:hypothetical protein
MPDMTPQGLADAINGLVENLPQRRGTLNPSWQRVLVEQALRRLVEGDPEVAAAVRDGLTRLLTEEPALYAAVVEAFGVEDWGESELPAPGARVEGRTEYATTPLGLLLWSAADTVFADEVGRAYDEFHRARQDRGDGGEG